MGPFCTVILWSAFWGGRGGGGGSLAKQHSFKMPLLYSLSTLQMKGWWESNINAWFPFIYSHKWNCYFQNKIIMFCLPVLHSYICERFLSISRIGLPIYYAAGKYVDRSWKYINRPQTHESGNWDWGHAIPRKGIHKWDFPCSACLQHAQVYLLLTNITPIRFDVIHSEINSCLLVQLSTCFFSSKIRCYVY